MTFTKIRHVRYTIIDPVGEGNTDDDNNLEHTSDSATNFLRRNFTCAIVNSSGHREGYYHVLAYVGQTADMRPTPKPEVNRPPYTQDN